MSAADRLVEKLIIRRVVRELRLAGFVPVKVWDSEDYVDATTAKAVIQVLYDVDASCTVHFAPAADPAAWGRLGVLLVTGNGIDILSDWHCQNPTFDAALERVCDWVNALEAA